MIRPIPIRIHRELSVKYNEFIADLIRVKEVVGEKYLKGIKNSPLSTNPGAFGAGLRSIIQEHVESVEVFQSAQAALRPLKKPLPDIIITDFEMPDINGLEFVLAIRAVPHLQDIPVLVLTGNEDQVLMTQMISAGADSFLTKAKIKDSLLVSLVALAQLKEIYKRGTQGKQLEAVQALIGTYKHEFGNAITAIDGKLRKLGKENPALATDESFLSIQKWKDRMTDTLNKLNDLRKYEEQKYIDNAQILKTG